jgi:hypothetical protein
MDQLEFDPPKQQIGKSSKSTFLFGEREREKKKKKTFSHLVLALFVSQFSTTKYFSLILVFSIFSLHYSQSLSFSESDESQSHYSSSSPL